MRLLITRIGIDMDNIHSFKGNFNSFWKKLLNKKYIQNGWMKKNVVILLWDHMKSA